MSKPFHRPTPRAFSTLLSVLHNYLKNQHSLAVIGPAQRDESDSPESTISADSWVLAQEIESWLFSTSEGRLWVSKRLNPVKEVEQAT